MAKIYLYDCISKRTTEMESLEIAAKDALELSLNGKPQMIEIDVSDGIYPEFDKNNSDFNYVPETKHIGKFSFKSAFGWKYNVYTDDKAHNYVWGGSFNNEFNRAKDFNAKWVYLWPVDGAGTPLGMDC